MVARGELGRERGTGRAQRISGRETISDGSVTADACHYAIVKMHRMRDIKSEP